MELQRQLLHMVRCGTTTSDDRYLTEVAASEGLDAVRHIGASWNRYSIERLCPLTCRLLEQRGELVAAMAQLADTALFSAFIEDLAIEFLEQQIGRGARSVVADVARFEAAVLRLYGWQATGTQTVETIVWHHDPDVLIGDLLAGRPVVDVAEAIYRTEVSLSHPSLYRVCA